MGRADPGLVRARLHLTLQRPRSNLRALLSLGRALARRWSALTIWGPPIRTLEQEGHCQLSDFPAFSCLTPTEPAAKRQGAGWSLPGKCSWRCLWSALPALLPRTAPSNQDHAQAPLCFLLAVPALQQLNLASQGHPFRPVVTVLPVSPRQGWDSAFQAHHLTLRRRRGEPWGNRARQTGGSCPEAVWS